MERKRKIMVLGACILCLLILSPPGAQAVLITVQIEAVVDSVWDDGNYLEGNIQVGDTIVGQYTYNSDVVDSATEDWLGKYEYSQAPYGIILEVGGFLFESDPDNVDFLIYISNDRISPNGDIFTIVSNANLPLSNGTTVVNIWWQLNDYTGSAVSSDKLPLPFPNLTDWQANVLSIDADRKYGINAHVTSIIPEPCSLLLLGLGTMLLRNKR